MAEEERDRKGRTAETLGEESSYEGQTEMRRRIRRGDETEGDPDARDIAGAPSVGETPEGREDRSPTHHTKDSVPLRERATTTPGDLKESDN